MKLVLHKRYINYFTISVLLIVDAIIAACVGKSEFAQSVYCLCNVLILFIVSMKLSYSKVFEFIILFFLIYFYSLEVLLHYLKIYVNINFKYLILVPIILLYLRVFKLRKYSENNLVLSLLYIVLVVNVFVTLLNPYSSFELWAKNISFYIAFLFMYEICARLDLDIKILYKTIYYICILMTIVQFLAGFNNDTRNGLFGVFGLGVYSMFLMFFPIEKYAQWLVGKCSFKEMMIPTVMSLVGYLLTENKTGLILITLNCIFLAIITKKITLKKLLLPVILVGFSPFLFRIVIWLYPKFQFFEFSLKFFFNYLMGNSNWGVYKYGRFESLGIVFQNFNGIEKLFGLGIGNSTPLNTVFYSEMGIHSTIPYLASQYGVNHGYILTGLSTLLLDGGYLLLIPFVILICFTFVKSIAKCIACSSNEFALNASIMAVLSVIMYEFLYSNSVSGFGPMIMIGIVLGFSARIHCKKGK